MRNLEILNSTIKDWRVSDLAFITEMRLEAGILTIIFLSQQRIRDDSSWPNSSKGFFKITIEFDSVRDFHLNFMNTSFMALTGFDIIDVSKNGWEDINFQIEDYE